MKSNKDHLSSRAPQMQPNLHQTLSKEKEALVTMFLSSATQTELTEQIKRIDELCTKIDREQTKPH